MSALSLRIARKVYSGSGTLALRDLALDVGRGQFVAVVGPSGAGKTTLLGLVSGLDRDYEGEIHIAADAGPVSMVFQTPRLMPWLTVGDNLRLVLGRTPNPDTVRALLADFELDGLDGAYPGQLSGGMQRRVGLARAFAVRPRLLLMDEPFLSLDAPLAWRLREQLMALWTRYRPTVLYVTHDLDEALTLAERVVFLSAAPGRVALDQPVDLAYPRVPFDDGIVALKRTLLERNPQLLSGLVQENDTASREAVPDAGVPGQPPRPVTAR